MRYRKKKLTFMRQYEQKRVTIPQLIQLARKGQRLGRARRITVRALYNGGIDTAKETLLRGIRVNDVSEVASGCCLCGKRTRDIQWDTKRSSSALLLVQALRLVRGVRVIIEDSRWTLKKIRR